MENLENPQPGASGNSSNSNSNGNVSTGAAATATTAASATVGIGPNRSTHLMAKSWPAFAMMTHGMIDEAVRVMSDGGLMQPGVAERVQKQRAMQPAAAQ